MVEPEAHAEPVPADRIELTIQLIQAKLRLWNLSVQLENVLGIEIDTNGSALNDICAVIDEEEDVTEESAELFLQDLLGTSYVKDTEP